MLEELGKGGKGLATLQDVEAAAGVGDVEVAGERQVLLQHQADAMGVNPLLPDVGVQHDHRLPERRKLRQLCFSVDRRILLQFRCICNYFVTV